METKKIKLGRKFILFLVSLLAIIFLALFGKDPTQVVALFSVYCIGNVGSKISSYIAYKKEQV